MLLPLMAHQPPFSCEVCRRLWLGACWSADATVEHLEGGSQSGDFRDARCEIFKCPWKDKPVLYLPVMVMGVAETLCVALKAVQGAVKDASWF